MKQGPFSVFCVIVYVQHTIVRLYTVALSTRAMLNVLGKCDLLGEAMQPFVHHQHDGVAKIKYIEELRSRYAKFVYCNYNRVVRECHVSGRHQDSCEEAETSVAEKQKTKGICVEKESQHHSFVAKTSWLHQLQAEKSNEKKANNCQSEFF